MGSEAGFDNNCSPEIDLLKIDIQVVGRYEAGGILTSAQQCSEVSFLVSIGAPKDDLPDGYLNVPRKLRLLFGDTETSEDGPSESDIQRLIDLAAELRGLTGRVLIHCEAGVSRSTAAALILYTCLLGRAPSKARCLEYCASVRSPIQIDA